MRVPLLTVLALAACGSSDKADDGDDTAVDTFEDTFDSSPPTDTTGDDTGPSGPIPDTGYFFAIDVIGRATVVASGDNPRFSGFQASVARWMKDGTEPGFPRCLFYQRMVDWGTSGRPAQDDPVAPRLDACPGCDFAFSIVLDDPVEAERFPWTVDTDTGDTMPPPPDAVDDPDNVLNCESVQDQVRPLSDFPDNVGLGFVADPGSTVRRTGTVWLYLPDYASATGGQWASYAYGATWNTRAETVAWEERLPLYEYIP